jgi:regulatory protein YycI of two-component signal transduction system YycFG
MYAGNRELQTSVYVVFFYIIEIFIGFILYCNGKSRMQNRMETIQRQKERKTIRQDEIEWNEANVELNRNNAKTECSESKASFNGKRRLKEAVSHLQLQT